jgi:hypothetical protein
MFAALRAPVQVEPLGCLPSSGDGAGARAPRAGPIGALADAFAAIEPQLSWKVRAGAETQGEQFLDGHTPTRQSQVRRGSNYGAMSGLA